MNPFQTLRFASSSRRAIRPGVLITTVLLAATNIAHAGITETGVNFPEPVVSSTTNNYSIGHGAAGTLTINGGALFTAGALSAGDGGVGTGTITIDGSGTNVTFNPVGMTNILQPGNWGIGSVTISRGAVVDGTNTAAVQHSDATSS